MSVTDIDPVTGRPLVRASTTVEKFRTCLVCGSLGFGLLIVLLAIFSEMASRHFAGPLIALTVVAVVTAGFGFFMARGKRRMVALYGAFAARFNLNFAYQRVWPLPIVYWPKLAGEYRGRAVLSRMAGQFPYPWGQLKNHYLRRNHTILALAARISDKPIQMTRAHFDSQARKSLPDDVAALLSRIPESLKQRIRALYTEHKGVGVFVIGAGWVFYAEFGAMARERELNVFSHAMDILVEIAVAVEGRK